MLVTLSPERARNWPIPEPGVQNRGVGAWFASSLLTVVVLKIGLSLGAMGVSPDLGGQGIPRVVFAVHVVVFAAAGAWLTTMGRRDPRAMALGMFFLLVSTSFTSPLLFALARGHQTLAPALRFVESIQVEVFQPYFLWMFVRDFPRNRKIPEQYSWFRWVSRGTLLMGGALLLANLALAVGAPGGGGAVARLLGRSAAGSLYWPLIFAAMLPPVAYAVRQARWATPDERRRVRLVMAALVLGVSPIILLTIVAVAVPSFARYWVRPEARRTLGIVVYPAILSIPIVTAYAVLVHRALDLRLLMRQALRYALARYVVGAAVIFPAVVLAGTLYMHRDRRIVDVWSESGTLILASSAVAGALFMLRFKAMETLDRHFFREQYDARIILSTLIRRLRTVRSLPELAASIEMEMDRALHLHSAAMLLVDRGAGALVAPGGALRPLPIDGRLARRMEAAAAPLDVDWTRPGAWHLDLPESDQYWLSATDIRLLVPINALDGSLLGVISLGEKRSGLPFTAEDRNMLGDAVAPIALWIEGRTAAGHEVQTDPAASAALPAQECTKCGWVGAPAVPGCEKCGNPTSPAPVPAVLAAKFRLRWRIGEGGMGVVYRATDVELDRDVAIKTLPRVSPRGAARLRDEARAMAAVSHPNLAQIYAAEAWNGTPFLVVEFLPRRTLSDVLSGGPLSAGESIELMAALAPALARLHDAGILHRDIKPSNIGFAGDGAPKLLDFGLAQVLAAAGETFGASAAAPDATGPASGWMGTPLYLAPESARGDPPDVLVDLWALAMVLYEAVAGRHPFAGQPPHMALLSIYDGVVPDVRELAPDVPPSVAALLRDALHTDRRRRPQSAAELADRLRSVRRTL